MKSYYIYSMLPIKDSTSYLPILLAKNHDWYFISTTRIDTNSKNQKSYWKLVFVSTLVLPIKTTLKNDLIEKENYF